MKLCATLIETRKYPLVGGAETAQAYRFWVVWTLCQRRGCWEPTLLWVRLTSLQTSWALKGSDLQSLQNALGPKVDLWSFGFVLFEVCSGSMLMEPVDRRQKSPKQIIGDWCAHWQELRFLCRSKKEHKNSNHSLARLLRCHDWCLVALALCHPLPKHRKLLKNLKGN